MSDGPNVLDEHGNNAAVRCPSCAKVFVFSRLINRQNGRQCPHCHSSRAMVKDGVLTVETIELQRVSADRLLIGRLNRRMPLLAVPDQYIRPAFSSIE